MDLDYFWWIPAVVPLVGAFVILLSSYWPISAGQGVASESDRRDNWKKFGVYLGVNLGFCLVLAFAMWGMVEARTRFPEVWHYKATGVKHESRWTERERRSRQVPCGTDKDGHTIYRTEYYYVTEEYGPYWKANVNGDWSRIDEAAYNEWKRRWGNERQTGMHKGSSAGWDRSIDGPIMECSWPGTVETIFPISEIHAYVNKIRLSQSILQFGAPTEQQLARFPRPADKGNTSPVVSYGGPGFSPEDNLFLRQVNAFLGSRYQIHTMLVTFGKDEPREVMHEVLCAWRGPNKNELCTFVGLDGQKVKWVEVYSWLDDTTLHATLRDSLAGEQPFTVKRYADLLRQHVPKLWHRKEFTPINEYLVVPISPIWFIIGLVLAILAGIGSFFLIEKVMFDGRGSLRGQYRRMW